MNTSGDRLKALLNECNLSASDFAAQRKVTPQHVNNWFHRGVPQARLDEIAELLCVRSKWLRTGEGPKHISPLPRIHRPRTQPRNEAPDHSALTTHGDSDARLPFHNLRNRQLEPIDGRYLRLPRQALDRLGVDPAQALCLSMPDYNMMPLIPFGAPLAIDCSLTRVVEGELYAVLHNGRLRIHGLSKRTNGALRLHSHDSEGFPCESYSVSQARSQQLEILGWVFWWAQYRSERPD
ncbi:LexA family transcriptional regulator [Pseudomonas huaxiensis]|uniref:LexA family transcriptional regulator n=1 Tax=Pseudomonas huaxiensis TaxID=2213017 RepID=UPI000DA6620E|nr:XRE family transcriptional regulator [Pseudomonas huaxiensis]